MALHSQVLGTQLLLTLQKSHEGPSPGVTGLTLQMRKVRLRETQQLARWETGEQVLTEHVEASPAGQPSRHPAYPPSKATPPTALPQNAPTGTLASFTVHSHWGPLHPGNHQSLPSEHTWGN